MVGKLDMKTNKLPFQGTPNEKVMSIATESPFWWKNIEELRQPSILVST